jgi:uncharacterized membrane protein YtjA (UPF0391 family)
MYLWIILFSLVTVITGFVAYTPFASSYEPVAQVLFLFFLALTINAIVLAFFDGRR